MPAVGADAVAGLADALPTGVTGFAVGAAAGLATGDVAAGFAAVLPAGAADFAAGVAADCAAAEGVAVVFSDISGTRRLFADGVIIFDCFAYLIEKNNLSAIQDASYVAMLLDGGNLVRDDQ